MVCHNRVIGAAEFRSIIQPIVTTSNDYTGPSRRLNSLMKSESKMIAVTRPRRIGEVDGERPQRTTSNNEHQTEKIKQGKSSRENRASLDKPATLGTLDVFCGLFWMRPQRCEAAM